MSYFFLGLITFSAEGIRRYHDSGLSGVLAILNVLPVIGALLSFYCVKATKLKINMA